MALDKFIPTTPEQEDPKQKAKTLDERTKDLLIKEKKFANHLAQNKSPTVQQFLKTWYQINVDQKNARYGNQSNFDVIKSVVDSGSESFKDTVVFPVMEKNSKTGEIEFWDSNNYRKNHKDSYGEMEFDMGTYTYSARYEVDKTGVVAMKLIYERSDWRHTERDLNKDGKSDDYLSKKSGLVILVDKDGGTRFYENSIDKEYSINAFTFENDTSKMKELALTEEDKMQVVKEFTVNYQRRKQLPEGYKIQEAKKEKAYKEKESKKNVQGLKKVL